MFSSPLALPLQLTRLRLLECLSAICWEFCNNMVGDAGQSICTYVHRVTVWTRITQTRAWRRLENRIDDKEVPAHDWFDRWEDRVPVNGVAMCTIQMDAVYSVGQM